MKHLLFLVTIVLTTNLFAQVKDLNETIFKNDILNSTWTNEDSSSTILIFGITADSVIIMSMNWAEGFFSNKWTYNASFIDNIFILSLRNPEYKTKTAFIYGYLRDDGALIINLQEKKAKNEKALLEDEANSLILFKYTE